MAVVKICGSLAACFRLKSEATRVSANRDRSLEIDVVRIVVVVESASASRAERVRELGLAGPEHGERIDRRAVGVGGMRIRRQLVRAAVVVDEGDALPDGDRDRARTDRAVGADGDGRAARAGSAAGRRRRAAAATAIVAAAGDEQRRPRTAAASRQVFPVKMRM
jgi:hypothetical protein